MRHATILYEATLNAKSFVRGNPGVQGSNLFVRLPLLLRAGCFDENLPSMTDRDLALRMLDVLENGIAFVTAHTVIHHADPGRERVTTCTAAKREGARKFLWKHGWRFSDEDTRIFFKRCEQKFGFSAESELSQLLLQAYTSNEIATWPTAAGDEVSVQAATRRYLSIHAEALYSGECGPNPSIQIPLSRYMHLDLPIQTYLFRSIHPHASAQIHQSRSIHIHQDSKRV